MQSKLTLQNISEPRELALDEPEFNSTDDVSALLNKINSSDRKCDKDKSTEDLLKNFKECMEEEQDVTGDLTEIDIR